MAANEAKIKFTAETGEFNDAIKKANGSMTELRAELKLNETQMKNTGASVELLEKKHSILKEQLAASQSKTEALNQKVQKAAEIFGENSQEASKLRTQLLNAQTAEEKLRIEINKCETELDQQKNAVEDTERATENLTEENKDLDKSLEEVEDSAGKVGDVLKTIGGTVCAAAVAGITAVTAAAVAAGKALVGMSVDGAAYADEVLTVSTQTGIATDKLQEYQYAAELIDVSTDTLTKSMAKQIKSMKGVQDGTKASVEAYDKLGVKVTNADGSLRNSDDVYWEVIDALGKMENETERDALAMQILGKSAQELNPLIEAGSERMAELGQQAHEAGYVLSDEALEAYGAFDDQLQYLSVGATAAKNALGGVLLPTLTDLATDGNELLGKFTRGVNECGGDISGIGDVISELMPEVVNKISEYLPQIADLALSIVGSLATALIDNLPSITSAFGNIVTYIVEALPAVVDGIMNAIPSIIEAVSEIFVQIVEVLPDLITSIVSALPTLIPALIDGLVSMIVAVCQNLAQIIQPIITYLPDIIISIIDALLTNLPLLIDGVVQLVVGIVQALPTIIVTLVEALPTIIQMVVDAIVQNVPMLIEATITIVAALIQALPTIIMALVTALPTILKSVWDAIVTVFQSLPQWFDQLFNGVVNIIGSVFPGAADHIRVVWEAIKNYISTVVESIKNVITTVWNSIKNVITTVINSVKNVISTVWEAIKTIIANVMNIIFSVIKGDWESVKQSITNIINAIKSVISSVWNAIKSVISSVVNGIKNTISSVFNGIKNTISSIWNGIKSVTTSVWNGIKTAITKPIESAKNTIKGIIDKIKGFFSGMKLEFPNIKMPHFKISPSGWKIGDLLKGSIPKLGIEWYAKAVDEPMVLASPTIFGYNPATGNLMGGGETKSEMIGGTNTVMQMIQSAVDRSMQAMNLNALAAAIEDLANRPIELDINGRQFALATAGDSDRVNGMRNRIIERGVLLD